MNAGERNCCPETELLLCCSGSAMDPAAAQRIRELASRDINWDLLLQEATAHGIILFLYRNLTTSCPQGVPPATLDQMRSLVHGIIWRNLFLAEELVKLVELLQNQGIRVIPFKGPALASLAYGNITLRQFADLDILVPEKEVLRARDLLVTDGFNAEENLISSQVAAALISHREHHFTLTKAKGDQLVELHWRIIQKCASFPLEFGELWQRIVPVTVVDSVFQTLSVEDTLLLLCVHGTRHAWPALSMISDLDGLIRRHPNLNWDWITRQSQRLGCECIVSLGLYLANHFYATPLPQTRMGRCQQDPALAALVREVEQHLFQEKDHASRLDPQAARENQGGGQNENWVFYLKARERMADRIRVCLGLERIPNGLSHKDFPVWARGIFYLALAVTPNESDREWIRLPATLAFLYFLVRPLRLALKTARNVGIRLQSSFLKDNVTA
jgi:hypothetical protein